MSSDNFDNEFRNKWSDEMDRLLDKINSIGNGNAEYVIPLGSC